MHQYLDSIKHGVYKAAIGGEWRQDNEKASGFMKALGFYPYRYSFLLIRQGGEVPCIELPEGYELRNFRRDHIED